MGGPAYAAQPRQVAGLAGFGTEPSAQNPEASPKPQTLNLHAMLQTSTLPECQGVRTTKTGDVAPSEVAWGGGGVLGTYKQ